MNSFLASLPRKVLVTICLVGGVFLIVLLNPPHSICDTELEAFKTDQARFLFLDPSQKLKTTTGYESQANKCRTSNSPGGCLEFFRSLRNMRADLRTATPECRPKIGGLAEVSKAIWDSLELMTRISWGSQPPVSFYEKFRWLDEADKGLFCELRGLAEDIYREAKYAEFRERMFKELPGAAQMSRQEAWQKMLLSLNCKQF